MKTPRPTSRLCVLTACLVAAGVLTACGGGDDAATTAQSQAAPANDRATAMSAGSQATTQATSAGTVVAPYFATWAFNDHSYNTWSLMDAKSKTGLKAPTKR